MPVTLDDDALAAIADAVSGRDSSSMEETTPSPYMTIPEAAEYLRCNRQRIDDLLSQRKLTRVKEGARTLVSRAEVEDYVQPEPRRR